MRGRSAIFWDSTGCCQPGFGEKSWEKKGKKAYRGQADIHIAEHWKGNMLIALNHLLLLLIVLPLPALTHSSAIIIILPLIQNECSQAAPYSPSKWYTA
jgi:hypothetical protein